jgi:hypothetical protein
MQRHRGVAALIRPIFAPDAPASDELVVEARALHFATVILNLESINNCYVCKNVLQKKRHLDACGNLREKSETECRRWKLNVHIRSLSL